MTKPTISDDEVLACIAAFERAAEKPYLEAVKECLADFLARRVPDAKDERRKDGGPLPTMKAAHRRGFNACRDMVLQGRKG